MRSITSQRWFSAAVAVVVLGVVVGVIMWVFDASGIKPTASTSSQYATSTGAPAPEEEQAREQERPNLDAAVKKAESALRTYDYKDTDATRKDRIKTCDCVTDRFLADPTLNLGFGDSMADQGMIESKFKVKAGEITYLSGEFKDATTARVTYSVNLERSSKDGPLPDVLIQSTSGWIKVSGQWRLDTVTPHQ